MDIRNYLSVLRTIDLFKTFPEEELYGLFKEKKYHISYYNKGSIIHMESKKSNSWDIILKGQITIQQIDEKGSILTVTEFSTGNDIGGNLLFSKHPYFPMTVLAKSDTTILHISRDLVLELCQYNKDFLIEFLKCISDKTTILSNKIKHISMKSIRESIIDFLNYEYSKQNNKTIKLPCTKKELAELMGIQRTSLSREFNKMEKDQLISYNAHSITIKDISIIKNAE